MQAQDRTPAQVILSFVTSQGLILCDVITGRTQQRERHPFCSLGVRENNLLVRDLRPWPGIIFMLGKKVYLSINKKVDGGGESWRFDPAAVLFEEDGNG